MARILKKQTKKALRKERAKSYIALNVALALVEGGLLSVKIQCGYKAKKQVEKIQRWVKECWQDVNFHTFTPKHMQACDAKFKAVENLLIRWWGQYKLEPEEMYATLWLVISMILDDTIQLVLKHPSPKWRYLQTTVATWTLMLLDYANSPRAEDIGGKMQLEAWNWLLKDNFLKV